jgi:Zn-dependent metalloprotease
MRKSMAFVMLVASFVAWAADEPAAAPKLLRAQDLPIQVEPEALQRQYNVLLGMTLERIEYSTRGPIHLIDGNTGLVLPADATERKEGDSAADILPMIKDILLASGGETLSVRGNSVLDSSTRALKLSQSIRGIPVINGRIAIGYDALTKRVSGVTAHFIPDRDLPRSPKVSEKRAEQIVPEVLAIAEKLSAADVRVLKEDTYLGYYADPVSPTPPQLVWAITVMYADGTQEMFYVDAITGVVVQRQLLSPSLTRKLYDANYQALNYPTQLPTAMSPGQISADADAKPANKNVGDADTKLLQLFPLAAADFPSRTDIMVRYGHNNPNAHHQQKGTIDYIWFSGAEPYWNSFAISPDAAFHEYAHGIAERSFEYAVSDSFDNLTGTLQETFPDILTTVVDIAMRGYEVPATWIISEGLNTSSPSTMGFRSFANPYADPDSLFAGQNRDWFPTRPMGTGDYRYDDSTIVSHAYYLLIHGGLHARWWDPLIPTIAVTGVGEPHAREIFFRAFRDTTMDSQPTFVKLRIAATQAAFNQYGQAEQTSVKQAFDAVGIGYQCTVAPTSAPNFILEDFLCAGRFRVNWPDIPGVNRYIAQIAPQIYGWSFGQVAVDGDLRKV